MKILIADDHPLVRQGLKQLLAAEPDMEVVGEAKNADETLELARSLEWDVLILDYSMPGGNGLVVLKEIKRSYPRRPVLVLSMHPEDSIAISVLRAGAAGYINKECASEELTVAIRKAVSGGKYVSTSLAEKLALELEDGTRARPHESLSDRISRHVDDCVRQIDHTHRGRIVSESQYHQHVPDPHPQKAQARAQCGSGPLCHQASAHGVAGSAHPQVHFPRGERPAVVQTAAGRLR